MKKLVTIVRMCTILFAWMGSSMAWSATIVGSWQTVDHKVNLPSSIITIWKMQDVYFGKIVYIYPGPHTNLNAVCAKCKGARHNERVWGMTLMGGLIEENGKYVNGRILDARSGHTYSCQAKVSPNGKQLFLRGYIGLPVFGLTDTWYRVDAVTHQRVE